MNNPRACSRYCNEMHNYCGAAYELPIQPNSTAVRAFTQVGGLGALCYLTSFLTIVMLGVTLNTKPDLTIET
ncbi:unnamed protein product [Linum trigynum]|uniref:Uncharacterized protein n=1 Tax=Linum trigynum TaxID=586398 RepID=A0AAV2E2K7_9ROSI